jgi:hypothetical protein
MAEQQFIKRAIRRRSTMGRLEHCTPLFSPLPLSPVLKCIRGTRNKLRDLDEHLAGASVGFSCGGLLSVLAV